MNDARAGRVSELHKSAFWIYCVTGMVMREPFANLIRHVSAAGLRDWQVHLELLRTVVVLMLMARLFLVLGLYFDEVYIRPESAVRFPRRNYAVDFLTGLMPFLTIVAASSAVGLHTRMRAGLSMFMALIIAFLLFDIGWLAAAAALRFSSAERIAGFAKFNGVTLAVGIVGWFGVRIAGGDQVVADQVALSILLVLTVLDMGKLIREYAHDSGSDGTGKRGGSRHDVQTAKVSLGNPEVN